MRDWIEKALPGKDYQYIGYARTGTRYYIIRPKKKGQDWYMYHCFYAEPSHFAHTLKELNDKLGSL